jgi:hypothetical protein
VRHRRPVTRIIVVVVAIAAVAAVLAATLHDGGGRNGGAAVHVAPSGTDGPQCGSSASPCASFAAAYAAARPGQRVTIAAGRYPAQTVPADGRPAASAPVVLGPDGDGAVVIDGELTILARAIGIDRVAARGVTVGRGARNVQLRNVTDTAGLFITSADDVDVIGGSVGPGHDFSSEIKAVEGSAVPPRRIRIEGVTFHDWTRRDPASHVDCLHVIAVRGLVLRGNRFVNCEAFDVLFTSSGDAPTPRHVLVENNVFSCCRTGYYALALADTPGATYRDFLVRHNSSDNSYSVGEGSTEAGSNVRFVANVGPSFNPALCGIPGVTWDHNVWASGAPCGPHDLIAPSGFRDPARHDFHLTAGAAAIGHGDPSSAPARDIDGDPRPSDRPPDAGAYQYRPAA